MAAVDSSVPVKRIRDLLRLAQSDNPNEASLARRRADDLLRRYNIGEADVAEQATEVVRLTKGFAGNQRQELARIIAKSRGVVARVGFITVSFIGFPEAAKDARQLFTALNRIVDTNCGKGDGANDSDQLLWRTCFWLGFVASVTRQLDPEHGAVPKDALATILNNAQVPPSIEAAGQALNALIRRSSPHSAENFKHSAYTAGLALGDRTPVPAYRARR